MTAPTPELGPCSDWITGQDVAAVCGDPAYASDPSGYDAAAHAASQVLYELSGRQFSGLCGPVTVRPCVGSCGCWAPGSLASWYSGGGGWWGGAYWLGGGGDGVSAVQDCGSGGGCCGSLSRVKLAGYPVREIEQVTINGDVVDPTLYRLDGWKWLTYLNSPDGSTNRWPACQNLAVGDDEDGAFAVTYVHGIDPPALGQEAAAQLACVLASFGGDCDVPPGTSQIERQGIRIEIATDKRGVPISFAALPLVQLFLATYNPSGLRRRAAAWSPDIGGFAQQVGQ